MNPFPRSLEGFRLYLLVLALAFPCLAAFMIFLQVGSGLMLLSLGLLSALLLFLGLSFSSAVASLLRTNVQCAQDMISGNYGSDFAKNNFFGLLGENQSALRQMLVHFKHELSLSRGVMHGMVTPCVVTDLNEVFIFGNPALITMLEHEGAPADFYGQDVSHFFYGEKRQTVLGLAMRENRSISKEVEFTGRKGGKRNIHIDASPLYDIEGQMMGALCIYTDLTDIRASETKLCDQNEVISSAADKATKISDAMASAARELTVQVEEASRGAEQQRDRTAETATAMEEMNTTVLEVARNASQAAEASDQARVMAEKGARIVGESVAAINTVQQQSLEMKTNLGQLGQQAEQIGRIMTVIEDIADQTNLLALNAAIEAARAGDAGRGFAVVADEVRKLAEKTMNATKEVGQAIAGIQQGTQANIAGMDNTSAAISEATSRANTSGETLQQILSLAQSAADQVSSIATAAEQQSATSEEINRGVDDINRISSQTSEIMSQSAEAVSSLAHMASDLNAIIAEMRAKSPDEC